MRAPSHGLISSVLKMTNHIEKVYVGTLSRSHLVHAEDGKSHWKRCTCIFMLCFLWKRTCTFRPWWLAGDDGFYVSFGSCVMDAAGSLSHPWNRSATAFYPVQGVLLLTVVGFTFRLSLWFVNEPLNGPNEFKMFLSSCFPDRPVQNRVGFTPSVSF